MPFISIYVYPQSTYLLTYWSICLHNTLVPNLKLFPGFQACFFTCSLRGHEHPLFVVGLDVLAVWWPEPGAGGGRCQSPSGSWSPWTRWWLLGRRIWRRYAHSTAQLSQFRWAEIFLELFLKRGAFASKSGTKSLVHWFQVKFLKTVPKWMKVGHTWLVKPNNVIVLSIFLYSYN